MQPDTGYTHAFNIIIAGMTCISHIRCGVAHATHLWLHDGI